MKLRCLLLAAAVVVAHAAAQDATATTPESDVLSSLDLSQLFGSSAGEGGSLTNIEWQTLVDPNREQRTDGWVCAAARADAVEAWNSCSGMAVSRCVADHVRDTLQPLMAKALEIAQRCAQTPTAPECTNPCADTQSEACQTYRDWIDEIKVSMRGVCACYAAIATCACEAVPQCTGTFGLEIWRRVATTCNADSGLELLATDFLCPANRPTIAGDVQHDLERLYSWINRTDIAAADLDAIRQHVIDNLPSIKDAIDVDAIKAAIERRAAELSIDLAAHSAANATTALLDAAGEALGSVHVPRPTYEAWLDAARALCSQSSTATLSLDVAALDESMNSRALSAFQASKRAQELKAQMIDTPFDTSLRLTCSDAVKQLFVPRFAFPVHLCRNVRALRVRYDVRAKLAMYYFNITDEQWHDFTQTALPIYTKFVDTATEYVDELCYQVDHFTTVAVGISDNEVPETQQPPPPTPASFSTTQSSSSSSSSLVASSAAALLAVAVAVLV